MLMFESLTKIGVYKRNKIDRTNLNKLKFSTLLDTIEEITNNYSQVTPSTTKKPFDFTASLTLSGGDYPCSEISCRARNIDDLARFSVFYSDEVIIYNFLADHSISFGHPPKNDSPEFRQKVVDDLVLLLYLKPLIDAKIIVPYTPQTNVCPYCLSEEIYGKKSDKRLKLVETRFNRIVNNEIAMSLELFDDEISIVYRGSEELLDHGYHASIIKLPHPIQEMPRIFAKLERGETVSVNEYLSNKMGFGKDLVRDIIYNHIYQMSVASIFQNTFLTSRDIDIQLIKLMMDNNQIEKHNVEKKYLNALIPYINDLRIKDILRLRNKEFDSFINFRNSLSTFINEYKLSDSIMNEKTIQELKQTYIIPEFNKLDKKIRSARSSLLKNQFTQTAVIFGFLGIGTHFGVGGNELRTMAGLLGLTKILDSVNKNIENYQEKMNEAKANNLYFIWKVRQFKNRKNLLNNFIF